VANTKNRIVRMDDRIWHEFGYVCAAEGTNRTAAFRDYAERRIRAFRRRGGVIPPPASEDATPDVHPDAA
jgi:hypothetical protein